MCCSYNPNKSNIARHLDTLRKSLDLYSVYYENTISLGDFNVSIADPHMEYFCESNIDLKVLLNIQPVLKIWKILPVLI